MICSDILFGLFADNECLWMPDAVYAFAQPVYVLLVVVILHAIMRYK
jgi:hypothetical protein